MAFRDGSVFCGATVITDEDTQEYSEDDVRTLGLQLQLCEKCYTTLRAGGSAPSQERASGVSREDQDAVEPEAPTTVPAVVEPPSIPSPSLAVERARMELWTAKDSYERLLIRDKMLAAREAARILGLREVQVDAAEVVALAERAIAMANQPAEQGRSDGGQFTGVTSDNDGERAEASGVTSDNAGDLGITQGNLRQMRQAHDNLTDEQFKQVAAEAREKGKPLTRATLKRVAKKLNATGEGEAQKPKEPTRAQKLEAQIEALGLEVGTLKQEKAELQMRVDWFEAQESDYDVDHYKRVNDQQAEIRTLQGRLNRLTNEREEARQQARYWKAEAMKLGWKESRGARQPELTA